MWQFRNMFRQSSKPRPSAVSRQRSFRPVLEALEDRYVPSSAGVISAITDPGGRAGLFAIGTNNRVIGTGDGTHWSFVSPSWAGTFREVSAGIDPNGQAHCYAISIATGNLWEFDFTTVHDGTFGGSSSSWVAQNDGGVCLHISATNHNACYAIGSDHNVYLYNGGWQGLPTPWDGAVQISAGVDQWGQDKVYVLDPSGYVLSDNHDGSWQWLYDTQRGYLRASQISAGIGTNWTGTDLFYAQMGSNNAYYFNGTTSTYLMASAIQISAGLDQWGNPICLEIY